MSDTNWKRAVVHAPDARFVQATVEYTEHDQGVHVMDRKTGTVIGVYQFDGPPTIKERGKQGQPELAGLVGGMPLTIVADCNCPRNTRRIAKAGA